MPGLQEFVMSRILVEAKGIDVSFSAKSVLAGAEIRVEKGEIVTLIGPNGAGKTTLVQVVLGLLEPDAGSVFKAPGLKIGYLPQRLDLNPALPLNVEGFLSLSAGRSEGHLSVMTRAAALDEVGAGHLMKSFVDDLSGGELQRVLLARALLRDPDLLVLDEPARGVDVNGQTDIYRLIGEVCDRRGCGVLLISHDLHLVMAATDRVVCLNRHFCCAGHPESVSRDPSFVALFGDHTADGLALYQHHHDHRHKADGSIVFQEHSEAEKG
jgi:zinc transport system ATP-binding protein